MTAPKRKKNIGSLGLAKKKEQVRKKKKTWQKKNKGRTKRR
jgi:hypothetical protein